MAELKLVRGRAVLLKGKKMRDTLAIVEDDDACDVDGIQMGRVLRKNLRCIWATPSAFIQQRIARIMTRP
jgi:hypothetical protein